MSAAIVPTGDISVIPQAWIARKPSASRSSISECGIALPPITIRFSSGSVLFCARSMSRTASHTVGTPAESVTRSCSHSSITPAGSSRSIGMMKSAPTIIERNGVPQALTWNIGTIGSTRSRSQIAIASASPVASACRYVERCENSTPFGSPVVAEV